MNDQHLKTIGANILDLLFNLSKPFGLIGQQAAEIIITKKAKSLLRNNHYVTTKQL